MGYYALYFDIIYHHRLLDMLIVIIMSHNFFFPRGVFGISSDQDKRLVFLCALF